MAILGWSPAQRRVEPRLGKRLIPGSSSSFSSPGDATAAMAYISAGIQDDGRPIVVIDGELDPSVASSARLQHGSTDRAQNNGCPPIPPPPHL